MAMEKIAEINGVVNEFIWSRVGLILLIGTGILLTVGLKFFQITHIRHWWSTTVGSIFSKSSHAAKKTDRKSISQFQALCTALAATIGTGNIAGVSAAIVIGGAGAVFWMWAAAFFGMMTSFAENVLGIYYRRRNSNGEWSGGAMYYLKYGLGSYRYGKTAGSILALCFAFFTIFASFGTGNMAQINKITLNLQSAFFSKVNLGQVGSIPVMNLIIGGILTVLGGVIILGGLQRIAAFSERIVPFMAITYVLGCLAVIIVNYQTIGPVFASIFRFAFGTKAVAGGAAGVAVSKVITQGCKRGIFSNEAGLGSSVIVHASSNVKEPVIQGMWGIFQVFFDTIVVCTMTAVVVLSSGYINLDTGLPFDPALNDATLVSKAFGRVFGVAGEGFIAIAILLFAFTTVLGWSQYGSKAVEYVFGLKGVKLYKAVFVILIISGAAVTSSLAWDISDTFNGLMMIPNLIGVVVMTPRVIRITRNYISRKIAGRDEPPMFSGNTDIQNEMMRSIE